MGDLVKKSWVEQILPVGSKGIIHEINVLQERYDCKICVENNDIDVHSQQDLQRVLFDNCGTKRYQKK